VTGAECEACGMGLNDISVGKKGLTPGQSAAGGRALHKTAMGKGCLGR
jgi:hypothetical protein